jgi:GNAT superfamily N-acetyltransferase
VIEDYDEKRHATGVLRLLDQMCAEAAAEYWEREHGLILHFLRQEYVLCAVASAGGQLVGLIIAEIGEPFFSRKVGVYEQILYVEPAHRGGIHAARLIARCERWARARGAQEMHLSQRTGIEADRTRDLFARLGFEVVGFNARKVL